MFLHNAMREPESQAGAGVSLSGIEGLEDASQIALSNPAAAIGDGNADSGPVRSAFMAVGPLASGGDVES